MRFQFAEYVLDVDRRELRLAAEPVALEPLVFDLLAYLVTNRDRVVSKEDVLEHVWSGRIVSESALTTRIAAARRAIGDSGEHQRLIRTVTRKGFRFVGEVRQESATAAASAVPVMVPPGHDMASPPLKLAVKPTLMVLPLENLGDGTEHRLFADGLTADIRTALCRDHTLSVIAWPSSADDKSGSGGAHEVRRIRRERGADYVLQGSLRPDVGQLRVNVQLIDGETGLHVWSDRYDETGNPGLAAQDRITAALARAVRPAIALAERQRARRRPPESLNAWEAWHIALGSLSGRHVADMRTWLQRAVQLDPLLAPAQAMLAFLYLAEATRGIGEPLGETAVMAASKAHTAIELSPRSGISHAMLGWAYSHQGDMGAALEEADTAIALDPHDPWGHLSKGHALIYAGDPAAAREPLAAALRLDPYGPSALTVLHQCVVGRYLERDYRAAEAVARRAIQRYPDNPRPHIAFAASLGQLGRAAEATSALDAAIAASPSIFRFVTDRRPHYYRAADHTHLLDGLRKAGWNG